MSPLLRRAEIGDSFDNLMYSFIVFGNTRIGDTDGAAVGNSIPQVYDIIDGIFTFVNEEGFECLTPVRIEATEKVLQPP